MNSIKKHAVRSQSASKVTNAKKLPVNKLNTINAGKNIENNIPKKKVKKSVSKQKIKKTSKTNDDATDKILKNVPFTISKNVETVKRLINNSQTLLNEQNNILDKYQDITKRITQSDFEVERILKKNENDEIENFLDKNGNKLNHIVNRLKTHDDEKEGIKYVQEENKNLKYKMELMSIDYDDNNLQYEAKYNSLRNLIQSELNLINDCLVENGYEKFILKSNFHEENISLVFQNLRKLVKSFKSEEKNISSMNTMEKNSYRPSKETHNSYERNNLKTNDLEDELNYFKKTLRDYERQIDELKKSSSNVEILPHNNEFFSFRPNECNTNQNNEYNHKRFDTLPSMSSFDNFKRMKEFKSTRFDENLSLENKYSDTNFFKPQEYDYPYLK